MPSLDSGSTRAVDIVYVVSAVDKSGRVADRNVVRLMGWAPGTRISFGNWTHRGWMGAGYLVARQLDPDGEHSHLVARFGD